MCVPKDPNDKPKLAVLKTEPKKQFYRGCLQDEQHPV